MVSSKFFLAVVFLVFSATELNAESMNELDHGSGGGSEPEQSSSAERSSGGRPIGKTAFEDGEAAVAKNVASAEQSRESAAKKFAAALVSGLDNGKLREALQGLLNGSGAEKLSEGNENFTGDELKEVFGGLLDKMSPEERTKVSIQYTNARGELRQKLLDAVIAELSKVKGDERIGALIAAIKNTKEASLDAYKRAASKIAEEKLGSPICFTCGEEVSSDPDYDFYTAMSEAAGKALAAEALDNDTTKPFFVSGKFGRTSEGKIVIVGRGDNGAPLARTSTEMPSAERFRLGSDPGLQAAMRESYFAEIAKANPQAAPGAARAWPRDWDDSKRTWVNQFLKNSDPENPVNKLKASALAAPKAVQGQSPAQAGDPVSSYLAAIGDSKPSAAQFPVPEEMGRVLGLVDPSGTPYVKSTGEGTHQDGSGRYGVEVDWTRVEQAPPAERRRVLDILKKIASAPTPAKYKVDASLPDGRANGHCIWCYLRNAGATMLNRNTARSN